MVLDGKNIGFINGYGNTSNISKYQFIDRAPAFGSNYYRLKQIDFDEVFEFSNIVSVVLMKENEIEIFPNPTNGMLQIVGNNIEIEEVKITDYSGKEIVKQLVSDQLTHIDISTLPNGIYYISLKTNKESIVKRIMKL